MWQKLATRFRTDNTVPDQPANNVELPQRANSDDKEPDVNEKPDESHAAPNEDAQGGVRASEAITLTWTKANLVTAYAW